jgi:hypothetical protein
MQNVVCEPSRRTQWKQAVQKLGSRTRDPSKFKIQELKKESAKRRQRYLEQYQRELKKQREDEKLNEDRLASYVKEVQERCVDDIDVHMHYRTSGTVKRRTE